MVDANPSIADRPDGPLTSQDLIVRAVSVKIRRILITGSGPIPQVVTCICHPSGRRIHLPAECLEHAGDRWSIGVTIPKDLFRGSVSAMAIEDRGGRVLTRFPVGPNRGVGLVERIHLGQLEGWFSHLSINAGAVPAQLQLLIDQHPVDALMQRQARLDLADIGFGGPDGFAFELPSDVFDGEDHLLQVMADGHLLPGAVHYHTRFEGQIAHVDATRVRGWMEDVGRGLDPRCFELITDRGMCVPVHAIHAFTDHHGRRRDSGFDVELPIPLDLTRDSPKIVHAQTGGTVVFGPEAFLDINGHVAAARGALSQLESGQPLSEGTRLWLKALAQESLLELRRPDRRLGHQLRTSRRAITRRSNAQLRTTTIVVPVYGGYVETVACLQSLHLALKDDVRWRVAVIDDRGPDIQLEQELPLLCEQFGFLLLRNERNLGFVGSINRGLAIFPRDDVLILNSDTLVPPGFLKRLQAHLRDPSVASVTPFSNNATILSFPRMNVENPIPTLPDVQRLDGLFAAANSGRSLEIPTGIGFCMLMAREALDRIGGFDPVWGKGYCEENDWSMRASDAGFRHLAACDVYVGHVGGSSFGPNRLAQIEHNLSLLNLRYPDYLPDVMSFIAQDPCAQTRDRVQFHDLAQDPREKILLISIALGGGIERHVQDCAQRLRDEGAYPLILRASHHDRFHLSQSVNLELENGVSLDIPNQRLSQVIAQTLVPILSRIHLHTLAGIPVEVLDVLQTLKIHRQVTLHDYATVCPRVTLLSGDDRFCNLPDLATCESCVTEYGAHSALPQFARRFGSVEMWRAYTKSLLQGMDDIFVPSDDLARRLAPFVPGTIQVVAPEPTPHLSYPKRIVAKASHLHIAIIGAIGPHKGLARLKQIVQHIAQAALPIRISILGYTADDAIFAPYPFVHISGLYPPEEAVPRIKAIDADCALFLSPWPETWSYTLSEALAANLPVAALDLGAIADRIRALGTGWLFKPSDTAEEICHQLLHAFQVSQVGGRPTKPLRTSRDKKTTSS